MFEKEDPAGSQQSSTSFLIQINFDDFVRNLIEGMSTHQDSFEQIGQYFFFNLFIPMEREKKSFTCSFDLIEKVFKQNDMGHLLKEVINHYKTQPIEGSAPHHECKMILDSISRRVILHFQRAGSAVKVNMSFLIKWSELTKNNVTSSAQSQAPYLIWRFKYRVERVLQEMTGKYDLEQSDDIVLNATSPTEVIKGTFANMIICRKDLEPPHGYSFDYQHQVYALLSMQLPLIGWINRILPAAWDGAQLSFVLYGFQGIVKIKEIYSLSENDSPHVWLLKANSYILEKGSVCSIPDVEKSLVAALSRRRQHEMLIAEYESRNMPIYVSPMVRYTGIVDRGIFHNALPGVRTITEMSLPGDIFLSDQETPSQFVQTLPFLNNGYRPDLSLHEPYPILQVAIPTTCRTTDLTKYFCGESKNGKGNDPTIVVKSALQVACNAKMLGYSGINIDVCCNIGQALEMGGGKKLLDDVPLLCKMVQAITTQSGLQVSVKILLPKKEGVDEPDVDATKRLAQALHLAGIAELHIQATTTEVKYYPEVVKEVVEATNGLKVVYNGNIVHSNDADLAKNTFSMDYIRHLIPAIGGIMIGRTFMGNPFLLSKSELLYHRKTADSAIQQLKSLECYYFKRAALQLANMQVGALSYLYTIGFKDLEKIVYDAKSSAEIIQLFEIIDLTIGLIEQVESIIFQQPQRGKVEDCSEPDETPTANASRSLPLSQALGTLGMFSLPPPSLGIDSMLQQPSHSH